MNTIEFSSRHPQVWEMVMLALGAAPAESAERVFAAVKEATGELELNLTINGVSIPFLPVAEALANYYDKDVEKQALQVSLEKMGNLQSVLYELEEKVRAEIKDKFPDAHGELSSDG
jgi:hypothetical protein